MPVQLNDPAPVSALTRPYSEELIGFNPEEWLKEEGNVALLLRDDLALFTRRKENPTTVCGHYFFTSRGRGALQSAKELLNEVFSGPYEVETIIGFTPLEKVGARWISRQLGFTSHGVIEVSGRKCEFFILTKLEHNKRK